MNQSTSRPGPPTARSIFGSSTYDFIDAQTMLCTYSEQGMNFLARLDLASGKLENIRLPFTTLSQIRVGRGFAVLYAGSAVHPGSIIRLDLDTEKMLILKKSADITVDRRYLSVPQPVEFPTENGLTAHAFYYPPQNEDYGAPSTEKPPLLVLSHGGPTSAAGTVLNLGLQYWTSRGFAVVDVNYGGSTGYGRAYRQRLNGQWGIVDVQDCVNAAYYLASKGWVDVERLAIRGGSAGGYTTLCALTFHDIFTAGASHFGVSDVEALAKETHKFESRYLDNLIGPYPEAVDLYRERSPIHFIDQIECPLILFQGLEDRVVPPNQAEMMYKALKEKGVPVAYLPFAGEQHGFRRAENIKRALDAEFFFYSRIFDFKPADFIKPVVIDNLG